MKRLFILSVVLAGIFMLSMTDKKNTSDVPEAVNAAFKKMYPGVTKAEWDKEADGYEVTFKQKGQEMSVLFDQNGKYLQTETDIKVKELPMAVTETIGREMKGFEIDEAYRVETDEKKVLYEVEVENEADEEYEVLVSAEGKIISKTQEEDKEEE